MPSLCDMSPGQHAYIRRLECGGSIRRRLLDIGLVEGTRVECVGRSPFGDPSAFLICGAVIAIRAEDCGNIVIENIEGECYGADKHLRGKQSH